MLEIDHKKFTYMHANVFFGDDWKDSYIPTYTYMQL